MKALWIIFASVALGAPLTAKPVQKAAENQVPVIMTDVRREAGLTIIVLQAQTALTRVCWSSTGPNSPYLIANAKRYRYVSGADISICPDRRDYAQGGQMRLRFQPLPAGTTEFSLVEGQGGENQMADPVGSTAATRTRYWNFLHVKL